MALVGGRRYGSETTPGKNRDATVEQIAKDLRHLSADQLAKPTQGGDRGVDKPLTTSDGKVFAIGPVPKTRIKKSRQRHKKWQQRASWRKKGSQNQKQAYRKAARYQQYEKNVRNEDATRCQRYRRSACPRELAYRQYDQTAEGQKRCQRPVSAQWSESQSRA